MRRIQAERTATAQVNQNGRIEVANINAAKQDRKSAADERLQASRSQDKQDNLAFRTRQQQHKELTDAFKREDTRQGRVLQDRRLKETALAREQRDRHFQIRQQQREIGRGYGRWAGPLGIVAEIIGVNLVDGLGRVARSVFDLTRRFEQLRQGYAAFVGSESIADREIARIRELADLPSISFEGGVRSVLQLQSAGFNFETSERLLTEMSNQVALFGGSTDALNRVLYQFVQVGGLQQFRQEELRQILEIVPGFRQVLQEVFGTFRGDEINDAIDRMGLTFDQATNTLLTRLEEGPRAPTDTLTNRMEILVEALNDLGRTIGEILTPALKSLIDSTTETVEAIDTGLSYWQMGLVGFDAYRKLLFQGLTEEEFQKLREDQYKLYEEFKEKVSDPDQPMSRVNKRIVQFLDWGDKMMGTDHDTFRSRLRSRADAEEATRVKRDALIAIDEIRKWQREMVLLQFSEGDRDLIRVRLKSGEEHSDIAEEYGVTTNIIRQIGGRRPPKTEEEIRKNLDSSTRELIDSLAEGSLDMLQPLRDYIREINKKIGYRRRQFYKWVEETDPELEERRKRFGLYESERNVLLDIRQALEEFIAQREAEIKVTQEAYQQQTEEAIRNRQPPDFRVEPTQALPPTGGISPDRKFYGEEEGDTFVRDSIILTLQGRPAMDESMNLDDDTIREWFYRPLISALRKPSPFADIDAQIEGTSVYRDIERFRRLREQGVTSFPQPLQLGLPSERFYIIPKADIERLRALGVTGLTTPDGTMAERGLRTTLPLNLRSPLLPPAFDDQGNLIPQYRGLELDRMREGIPEHVRKISPYESKVGPIIDLKLPEVKMELPDPRRTEALVRDAKSLLTEWTLIEDTVSRYADNLEGADLAQTFNPGTYRNLQLSRDELGSILNQLRNFKNELSEKDDAPERVLQRLADAIRHVGLEWTKLNDLVGQFKTYVDAIDAGQKIQSAVEGIREIRARSGYWDIPPEPEPDTRLAEALSGYFEQSGESLYDQFIAPSLLDMVGIGSGQSRAQERSLNELAESIKTQRREIRENELLSEREQMEQLLEINRSYEEEKRTIERQYEEERRDAWADWIRQQLTDFPKLIYQQLNLQLAARATNAILNRFNLGGNLPIGTPGFGLGNSGELLSQVGFGGGSGFGSTIGWAGTAASFALAAHNFGTGIKDGLFDDIGEDTKNLFSEIHNAFGGNDSHKYYVVRDDIQVDVGVRGSRMLSNSIDELVENGRI